MGRKIIGVTVGTPMKPQSVIEKTEQANQIKKNTEDIANLSDNKVDKVDGHSLVSNSEKEAWNAKSNFSGKYTDLVNKPSIPSKTSELTNDSGYITSGDIPEVDLTGYATEQYVKNYAQSKGNYITLDTYNSHNNLFITHKNNTTIHVTDLERNAWNNKSDFSGSYNDLTDKPTIPSLSGYATTSYVNTQRTNILKKVEENYAPLIHNHAIYPLKDDVDDQIEELTEMVNSHTHSEYLSSNEVIVIDNVTYAIEDNTLTTPTITYNLEVGKEYNVIFNSVLYSNLHSSRINAPVDDIYYIAIGNKSLLSLGENTSEPFLFITIVQTSTDNPTSPLFWVSDPDLKSCTVTLSVLNKQINSEFVDAYTKTEVDTKVGELSQEIDNLNIPSKVSDLENDLIVNITQNDDGTYAADKTYKEIEAWYTSGRPCYIKCSTQLLPVNYYVRTSAIGSVDFSTIRNSSELRIAQFMQRCYIIGYNNSVTVEMYSTPDLAYSNKANVNHKHTIDNITNLQSELDKIPTKTSQLTNDSGFITLEDVPESQGQTEVFIQDDKPTDGSLWIDTNASDEIILVEIDDNVVSDEKTWSSSKIDIEINNLKTQGVQLYPLFAESEEWLNENGETDKLYVLDGNVWAYNTENKLPSATYTNQIPLSVNADGSEYIGHNGEDGYSVGYRVNSSGVEEQVDGMCVTGYIPCTKGQVIRLKNVTVSGSKTSYLVQYYADKSLKQVVSLSTLTDSGDGVLTGTVGDYYFIRITCGVIDDTSILTLDEEIVGDTSEPSYKNVLPTALTPNDITTVFDGKGYKNGYYASAAEPFYNTDSDFFCSGLMVIPSNKIFYIKGCTINTSLSHTRFGLLGENGELVNTTTLSSWNGVFTVAELGTQYYCVSINTNVIGGTGATPYYFYFSASGTGDNVSVLIEDVIITPNEEINDGNIVTEVVPYTVMAGVKLESSTGNEVSGTTNYSASSYIEIENDVTYTLTRASGNGTKSCKICYYDTDKNFISTSSDIFSQDGDENEATNDIPLVSGAKFFRLRIFGSTSSSLNEKFIVKSTKIYKDVIVVTKWTNTGLPFVAGDYDEVIAELNHDVNNLKGFVTSHESRLKKLENEGITVTSDGIPSYVKQEANEVIDRVLDAQSTRTFNMIVMTDLHNNAGESDEQILHANQGAGYIANRIKIDAFASLGDHTDNFASSSWKDGQADMEAINAHHHKYLYNVDELRMIGNHDFKESRSPKTYKMISAFSKNVAWGDMLGCYFYKDYEDYKLRVICLNTSDEQYIGMSNAQYNWFIQSLDLSSKSNASEWQILIMSHVPLDWNGFTIPVYILRAYLNGTSWSNGTISCNFANKNQAKIIATVHGHIHNFLVDKLHVGSSTSTEQLDIYRIAMPEVTELYHNHYEVPYKCDTSYPKTSGTAEDTSFNVLCIDLDNKIIKAICYGAGVDREISY